MDLAVCSIKIFYFKNRHIISMFVHHYSVFFAKVNEFRAYCFKMIFFLERIKVYSLLNIFHIFDIKKGNTYKHLMNEDERNIIKYMKIVEINSGCTMAC